MAGTKKQDGKEYSSNWGGARTNLKGKVGRKATGVKRVSFAVSCKPEELEELKKMAQASGKNTSKFLLDLAFGRA